MDVYDVSDELVKQLQGWDMIGSISEKLNEFKDNYSKVYFVECALIDFNYMEKILATEKLREEKCEKKSTEFRLLGNEQFALKNRNYFQALEMYNKSICYSTPGSENLSIGYANRSAVLFAMKRFRECLANIELARQANYPSRLMHKLNKRESDCHQLIELQDPDTMPYDFQMPFDSHPVIPHIADCLELRETETEGRFIATNRDLQVGDLVATEEPFCSTLLTPMRYIRCATCKQENYLTLIPCDHCCSVMFCSTGCKESAMATFHKYECPIIDLLQKFFNKVHGIALRVCLSALELFPTIQELIAFCANPDNQNKSAFDLDYTNLTAREHYRAIHGLVTNQHLRSVSDLFQRAVVCAIMKHFVIEYTPLKDYLGGEEGHNFFTELLFRHMQTSPSNMHGIDLIEQLNETQDDQSHSSGEQLYDTYGPHFAVFTKKQRIERLLMQYRFTCQCEACEDDYPSFGQLPPMMFVPYINDMSDTINLISYNYDFALENYRKYCDFLTEHGDAYPCEQISSAEECLKMALHILVESVPLKARLLPKPSLPAK